MTRVTALSIARERQLDWLLTEVLREPGAAASAATHTGVSAAASRRSWLAAALILIATAAVGGVIALRNGDDTGTAQDPQQTPLLEAHGKGSLAGIPADARRLRCFDFDDAELAGIARLQQLEELDLSGMDVNAQGYSVSLPITDAGIRHLAGLRRLRSLTLDGCGQVAGESFGVLESMPLLEHLDLSRTQVTRAALAVLHRLPSLRTLLLSHCANFPGEATVEIARIVGLRRLELRGCWTLRGVDIERLAALRELRHLDLRDCQGHFRGQVMGELPFQGDRLGATDAAIAALAKLPLVTLQIGGCEHLTDAIGPTLAAMTTLRELDLSELPKIGGALLAAVPDRLEVLQLNGNAQLDGAALGRLPRLPGLREFGLSGLPQMSDLDVQRLIAGRPLHTLHLGGAEPAGKGFLEAVKERRTPAVGAVLAGLQDLEHLTLRRASWLDAAVLRQVAALPKLRTLDLTATTVTDAQLAELGGSRSLASLQLIWCKHLTAASLTAIASLPLRELDLYGTTLDAAAVNRAASQWPGCRIRHPKGHWVPAGG